MMTTEDKLKAVIEAQVKGGCLVFDDIPELIDGECYWVGGNIVLCDAKEERIVQHVLGILLDTEGCKAAYGDKTMQVTINHRTDLIAETGAWQYAAGKILDAWHSDSGNNLEEAIDTAYSLLPDKS